MVRDLQDRLNQLGLLDGGIDGIYGPITASAVRAAQALYGLDQTGSLDQRTWDRIVADTHAPTPAPPVSDALMSVGSTGDQVRELQARLNQLGYFAGTFTGYFGSVTEAAIEAFQSRRGFAVTGAVDQRTWDKLVSMTRTPTYEEKYNLPSTAGLDPRCLTGRVLCASKTTRKVVWVVDGVALLVANARFGSAEYPSSEGSFAVYAKYLNWWSTLWDAWMPYSMFFNGGEAVHYSYSFASDGYDGNSHGCLNLRDWDVAEWLYNHVQIGDKVIVYH